MGDDFMVRIELTYYLIEAPVESTLALTLDPHPYTRDYGTLKPAIMVAISRLDLTFSRSQVGVTL